MENRKAIYISGPISGVERFWEAFEKADDELLGLGFIPLNPSRLPCGLTRAQYMKINFATIDAADAVYFLPGWEDSKGAKLEMDYCLYIGKPIITSLEFLAEVIG